MPNVGNADGLDLLQREPEPEPARTLVVLEVLFCDHERDPEILDRYFARFEHALAALRAQEVPEDAELLITVQISADKRRWIDRLVELLRIAPASHRTRIRMHQYEHPEGGYEGGDMSRVDWVKNPNKHSPYRERLFLASHQDLRVDRYARVIRVGLDDDDIWMPWQTANLCRIATAARLDPRVEHTGVLGIGMMDTMVGYVGEDGVELESVQLKRSLTGDKFHVIDGPQSLEEIARYSPIAVPERVELEFHERLKRSGVGLYAVSGYVPGFVYMRWGANLSGHAKRYLETRRYGSLRVDGPEDVHAIAQTLVPRDARPLWFGVPGSEVALSVSARRIGAAVHVDSNLHDLNGRGLTVCYYLMKGKERVGARWYSAESRATFEAAPSGVAVRAFVKGADGAQFRAQSQVV